MEGIPMTHEEIWGAIEKFALSQHKTCSGLARTSGLDPTTFNRSKRWSREGQPRWPSTQSIAKILSATGTTIDDFLRHLSDSSKN
jgi:phage repressor protein C with HTH and peptisase S24 domain